MTMFGSSIDFLTHRAKDITQTNLRSIKRIVAGDNAQELAATDRKTGTLGRVIRISADNMSKQDSIRFFQNAMSFMKFQEETIEYARQLYSQMHALAQEAQSASISPDERDMLEAKFLELRDQALDLNNLQFNGMLLFDQYAGSIKYDVDVSSDFSNYPKSIFEDQILGNDAEKSITREFVYNSGILVFDVGPGGGPDKFKLSQQNDDGSVSTLFETYWRTAGMVNNGDFDRFIIEWGPDKETTFRFVPLKEGSVQEIGKMQDGDISFEDEYYDNKANYLYNFAGSEIDAYGVGENDKYKSDGGQLLTPYGFGITPFGSGNRPVEREYVLDEEKDWWASSGFEDFLDTEFSQNYSHLEKQNIEITPAEERKLRSQNVILDTDAPTTIPLTGFENSQNPSFYVKTGSLDPLNTKIKFAHIANKENYSSQLRYKFYLPETDNIDVGNEGDLPTFMKPLGLGLLHRSYEEEMQQWKSGEIESYSGKNGEFPTLNINDATEAKLATLALENEMIGLTEQIGILGNNMARVMSSMEAVDKQLGIQRDLIAVEPEQVVLQELENLSYAREMRSFNASLMNKVVQINHDMIDLLLQ